MLQGKFPKWDNKDWNELRFYKLIIRFAFKILIAKYQPTFSCKIKVKKYSTSYWNVMKQKSKAALISFLSCLAPWRQTHSLLKERFNQLWLILTFVILFFSLPVELYLPFIWSNHSRNIHKFHGKVYFTDPVPCRLLVFSNSIFEFTFFVLAGREKLCSAWSPPLQILLLHPWAWWWHHGGKTRLVSQIPVSSNENSLRALYDTKAGPQILLIVPQPTH